MGLVQFRHFNHAHYRLGLYLLVAYLDGWKSVPSVCPTERWSVPSACPREWW
jgi:hypothetical protein